MTWRPWSGSNEDAFNSQSMLGFENPETRKQKAAIPHFTWQKHSKTFYSTTEMQQKTHRLRFVDCPHKRNSDPTSFTVHKHTKKLIPPEPPPQPICNVASTLSSNNVNIPTPHTSLCRRIDHVLKFNQNSRKVNIRPHHTWCNSCSQNLWNMAKNSHFGSVTADAPETYRKLLKTDKTTSQFLCGLHDPKRTRPRTRNGRNNKWASMEMIVPRIKRRRISPRTCGRNGQRGRRWGSKHTKKSKVQQPVSHIQDTWDRTCDQYDWRPRRWPQGFVFETPLMEIWLQLSVWNVFDPTDLKKNTSQSGSFPAKIENSKEKIWARVETPCIGDGHQTFNRESL